MKPVVQAPVATTTALRAAMQRPESVRTPVTRGGEGVELESSLADDDAQRGTWGVGERNGMENERDKIMGEGKHQTKPHCLVIILCCIINFCP